MSVSDIFCVLLRQTICSFIFLCLIFFRLTDDDDDDCRLLCPSGVCVCECVCVLGERKESKGKKITTHK